MTAQWSRPTLCGYQNQPCVPLGYQSGYLLLYLTGVRKPKNPVLIFWTLVFESFGNFRKHVPHITTGSFDRGGEGRFLYPPLVRGRGMWSDRHFFPSDGCDALWKSGLGLYTWPVQKPWWYTGRLLLHRPLPPPPPKTPVTDRRSELIY